MRILVLAALLVTSQLLPRHPELSGQSVLVEVRGSDTGGPISGVFLSLLDREGRIFRRALTNEQGRFLFQTPDTGSYRIRAEMIGRETQVSPPLHIGHGELGRITLSLPFYAIPLAGILVEADERCTLRPDEASVISRVWDEARKALALQAWTEEEGLYEFWISSYERDLDERGRKVEREDRWETTAMSRTPIGSLPAEDLMANGFVRELEDGGYHYFGPDASVLLSDLFLDSHCLRLTESRNQPGTIGIAFEPAEKKDWADIEGTLWVERETGNLSFLEWGYSWTPQEEGRDRARGLVEFSAMPTGEWIIRKWWIRMPILGPQRLSIWSGRLEVRVAGIREVGGEVSQILALPREALSQRMGGTLSGQVWDSTLSTPLSGASVYLSGTSHSALADDQGRFLLEGVSGGVFSVAFSHPRLDSLGIPHPQAEVEVLPGNVSEVTLAIPSTGTLLVSECQAEAQEGGAAVVAGLVSDQRSGEPVPRASVRFDWQEITEVMPLPRALNRWFQVETDGNGRYTACGVPLDEAIVVQASFLGQESDTAHVRFLEEDFRILDLEMELAPGFLSSSNEAPAITEGVGIQGIQGFVREPEQGEPVRAVDVTLRRDPGGVVAVGTTNARGFFRLQTPLPGDYLLSLEALGFATVRSEPVAVSMGKLTVLEIQLAPEALALEPLVITAEPRAFHLEMEGFYERRETGLHTGIFMSPEVLEERQPQRVTDMFFLIPGTTVVETMVPGQRGVYFRSGERMGAICWPMVFLDRQLLRSGGFEDPAELDALAQAFDVAAIEVYRSAAEIPPEFNGANAGCGVIVMWTKKGGGE
jgi:hypothetical protein